MTSIFQISFFERSKLSMAYKHLDNRQTATVEDVIIAAQQAIEEHPREWILLFFLADHLQKTGRYAEAMPICQKAVELNPNDVRPLYTLATNYNILTRAAWTTEDMKKAKEMMKGIIRESDEIFDPNVSRSELTKLGIDIDIAALQAIRWFERALALNSDNASRSQIGWDLATLYKRFPHLKA